MQEIPSKKLIVAQVVNKFSAFKETQMFVGVFKTPPPVVTILSHVRPFYLVISLFL